MTDTSTTTTVQQDTADVEPQELELVTEPEPFLRIVGTYPLADGRVQTVELSMDPGDGEELGVVDDHGATRSWLTDFCVEVIAELRRTPAPSGVVVLGAAAPSSPATGDDTAGVR
jgi:hypothetical protein